MGLLADKWRAARSQVESTLTLAELAAFEVEELGDGRRPSVLQAIEERASAIVGEASDDDKLVALELVSGVEESKVSAIIEGVPSRDKGDGDKDVQPPAVAVGGGTPSMTVGRIIGPLVRVTMPDGTVRTTGLGFLRR